MAKQCVVAVRDSAMNAYARPFLCLRRRMRFVRLPMK